MGKARDETAGEVEQDEARRAQPFLNPPAEQPQRPHVDDQVKPIGVHEQAGQERQNVDAAKSQFTGHVGIDIAGREQPVVNDELPGQIVGQANLKHEYRHVGHDQADHRARAVLDLDGGADGDHVADPRESG